MELRPFEVKTSYLNVADFVKVRRLTKIFYFIIFAYKYLMPIAVELLNKRMVGLNDISGEVGDDFK